MKTKTMLLGAMVMVIGLIMAGLINPSTTFAKKLIIGVHAEPNAIDVTLATGMPAQIVDQNWGERLILKTTDGDLMPGLATSWKVSPDGKTVDFTLRKGVKFHSGDAFTAKDVEFSFQRGIEKNRNIKSSLRLVDRFKAVDDYHFRVYFKEPDNNFIPNRGTVGIVSKAYNERVGEAVAIKKPVGTGPYKMMKYAPGEYIDIERFEDYYGPKPNVKEARLVFASEDTTRLAMLKSGEADLINNVPWAMMDDLKKTPGIKLVTASTNHPSWAVLFSTRNPNVPWHDRRVRLAMAHAIDRETIIRDVLRGVPDNWGYIAPYQIGYDPAVKPWNYDPEKSKKLLAEAGYPNGFDFKLYWPVGGTDHMNREVVQVIAAQLNEVGIRTQLMATEYATFRAKRRAAKKPDAVFVGYFSASLAGALHPSWFLQNYFSGKGGFSIYDNPEVTKLAEQARSEMDDAKCGELIKKAVKIMYQDVPSIPVFNVVAVWAMKDNIDFKPLKKHNMDLMWVKNVTMK